MLNSTQKIAWLDFVFTVPAAWEVTAYSIFPKIGRLEFNDRHGYQGRIAWQAAKKNPDLRAMMNDFFGRYLKSRHSPEFSSFRSLEFCNVTDFIFGFHGKDEPCLALTFLEEKKTIILCLFPQYGQRLFGQVIQPMLASFRPNSGTASKAWRLFGLDLKLTADYWPTLLRPLPADITLSFENRKHIRLTFRRWGASSLILRKYSLEAFYANLLIHRGARIIGAAPTTVNGHEAVAIEFNEKGSYGFDKLYGARWLGRGTIWLHSETQRLYAFDQLNPRKKYSFLEAGDVLNF